MYIYGFANMSKLVNRSNCTRKGPCTRNKWGLLQLEIQKVRTLCFIIKQCAYLVHRISISKDSDCTKITHSIQKLSFVK